MRRLESLGWSPRAGLVVGSLLALAAGGAAQQVTAQPDRDRPGSAPSIETSFYPDGDIGVDETVQLKVSVTLATDADVGRPRMDLENLELVAGPGESNQIIFTNGVTRRIVSFTWNVRAGQVGEAKLAGGTIRIGGGDYALPTARAQVLQEPPQRQSTRRRDPFGSFFDHDPFERGQRPSELPDAEPPKVFLEAVVEPSQPWVGQQAIYSVYLYTNVSVRSVTVTDIPEFQGSWALPLERGDDVESRSVTRDGRPMTQFLLMQKVIFPRRAGSQEIGPTEAAMAVVERGRGFFSGPSVREMRRRSNAVTFSVRELPQPEPVGFQGVVGDVTLRADVEPRDLAMGDAATLKVVLDGRGHLQGVPPPEIPASDAFEVFPPQQQSREEVRGQLVYGTRTWSYVVVPKQTGAVEVPAIRVPFFDPKRGAYRVAETEPLRLAVRGSTQATQDSDRTVELHPIRTSTLPDVAMGSDGVWPAGRHALFALPMLAALGLFVLRKKGLGPGSGRAAHRKQLVTALAAAGEADKPRQVAAAIEDAWRDYLAARWSVPRGTASTQWSRLMTTHGASRDAAEELVALADDLHYLRYAPKLSSTDEMQRELVERSRRLVRRLG